MNSKKNIEINSRIQKLENDFKNGSSVISQKALKIFIDAIDIYSKYENDNFNIAQIAARIIRSKPSMASLKNIINAALTEALSRNDYNSQEIYENIIQKINLAKKETLDTAIKKIEDKKFNNIITCSYSSAVINLFAELKQKRNNLKVIVLELIWRGMDFSNNMKKECENLNIVSEIVKLNQIPFYDFAIIGADNIIKSKGIVNGIPSKYLAEYSFNQNLPFYVIGESYKISNNIVLDDGFELVDNQLISDIFSDDVF